MPKRVQPLSEGQIDKAFPRIKEYKLSDGNGLYLLVNSAGSKLWRFKYHFAGKEKLIAIGAYPSVSIDEARRQRSSAKDLLADGIDPSEIKKPQKVERHREDSNPRISVCMDGMVASHMNAAFATSYFRKLGLISLLNQFHRFQHST